MPRGSGFVCTECGFRAAKWLGRCPACERWGSLGPREDPAAAGPAPAAVPLTSVAAAEEARLRIGIGELDRVLGGGLVPGAAILIGGDPGVGKSTLLLQAAARLAGAGQRVLYVSGEESPAQLRLRGRRLGIDSSELLVVAETDVDRIVDAVPASGARVVIVDSVQAVRCAGLDSVPGSVQQVRESAGRLVRMAKAAALPVLLVGHVTKDGLLAGPRTLEHLVDTVVQFDGGRHHSHRILRALKNRFGATDELGVFEMTAGGLAEVANPSALFLDERPAGEAGSAVLAALVGSRPLLVELQALVGDPTQGSPRRTTLGVDSNRVAMVLSVLQRRAGTELANRDVFVNVTGGLTVAEPAADLAIAAAAASSARRRALPAGQVILGEIGLTGEVRAVSALEPRLREAARLGFTSAVVPANGSAGLRVEGLRLVPVRRVTAALAACVGADGAEPAAARRRHQGRQIG